MTKVDIEDERLLEIYLRKCETRKSVPKVPQRVVASLREKDPVFAKRFRQVYEARVCSRAPNFDVADHSLANTSFPKLDLGRLRKRIMSEAMITPLVEKSQLYRVEMSKADEKVKRFLEEVKVTQLC